MKSYLQQLTYNPKLEQSLLAKYLLNPRLVFLLTILIIIAGITSYISLPRTLNPEVEIPIVIIQTTLPGASPQEVEELLTIPLEKAVNGISEVNQLSSSSQQSSSNITLEFNSTISPEDAQQEVQTAVDTVVDLPEDASTPRVQAIDFEEQAIWTFALSSTQNPPDYASLNLFADQLVDELENFPSIQRVVINGQDRQQIQILIDPTQVATYNLSPLSVSQSIEIALTSFPIGNVITNQNNFTVAIDPTIQDIQDLRNLLITVEEQQIQLGQIAKIQITPNPDSLPSYLTSSDTSPRRIIEINIFKSDAANITDAGTQAREVVEDLIARSNGNFKINTLQDVSQMIGEEFDSLISNFTSTIILVFLTLFFFLGIRQAIITAFAIPLSFFTAFTVMRLTDLSLNFLAIFSLLIALGLLVDDAIVVVDAMTRYYRTGKFTAKQTGLLVWQDFIVPIWTTTITTVWAFVPLLLATGIIGEFIKSIPIIVSAALLSSTAIAVLITLPLMIIILDPHIPYRVIILFRILIALAIVTLFALITPPGPILPLIIVATILLLVITYIIRKQIATKTTQILANPRVTPVTGFTRRVFDQGLVDTSRISNKYKQIITTILQSKSSRRRVIFIVIIFSLLSYLLVPLGFVVNEFFPRADSEVFYAQLELPAGTDRQVTITRTIELLEKFRNTQGVELITANIGQAAPSIGTVNSGPNIALFTFRMPEDESLTAGSVAVSEQLRGEYADYQLGELSIVELSSGPPAGADLQITLTGPDLSKLALYAKQVQDYLQTQEGITRTDTSIRESTPKVVFIPNYSQMLNYQLTPAQVGLWLRNYIAGSQIDTLTLNDQTEYEIVYRATSDHLQLDQLSTLQIQTPQGLVPIIELGDLELRSNPSVISRIDGNRSVTITAGVSADTPIPPLNANLETYVDQQLSLSGDYGWQTGGINEENEKSVQSIIQAMGLAAVLILATMVIQLGSIRQAILVILVIPLAISGVFVVFAITGISLSFPALIGLLALFGIVVNNSIVVIDKINENLRAGLAQIPAIADAAAGRLEAIMFSSLTTVVGLLPITLSDPIWQGTGGAIIAGLLFSGSIMLFFIPVVYYAWFVKE